MKIECIKDKILWAVDKAGKIAGKNINLPVLACLLFDFKKNNLTVRSTNLDLGVEVSIPVKTDYQGTVAVPAQTISGFLSNLKGSDKVTLEVDENKLWIYTDKNETSVLTQPHDDFPSIPLVKPDSTFQIKASEFLEGVKSVWYSASTSNMKPELSSVYIYSDDGFLVFVATDSFRLAEKRIKFNNKKEISKILIPFKNTPEIIRVLEGQEGEIEVRMSPNQLSLIFDTVHLTTRVVDGSFPDYKQIVPKEHTTEATLLKEDLADAIKLSNIFSGSLRQVRIKVDPKNKILEITSRDAEKGEYRNTIDAVLGGDEVDMGFNYNYLADCFQSIHSDSITLRFNGERKPLVIKPVGDGSFFYLAMPMNK